MSSSDASHKVGIVTASAGTGKTYDLTSRIEAEIESGRAAERILASTFTVKAAGELRERARERLIAKGDAENAVRLLGARIGTINGVCGGLVKEFAFGLGLSPVVNIIEQDAAARVFLQAADASIGKHADEVASLARVFGYEDGAWSADVGKIVDLARANNVDAEALPICAERSIAGFAKLMQEPLPGETAASLDATLRAEIDKLLSRYQSTDGVTKGTIKSLDEVRDIAGKGKVDELPWQHWAKLSKASGTKADDEHFEPLRQAASAFARHPRLLEQVKRYVTAIFSCAAEAMRAYEDHKRAWGLVDFVDQDRLALKLLENTDLDLQLRERIESVFVDEFQDTSPLQLAVFVAMSRIAKSSIWVGDPKQAIYGFRGTDPDLITHVAPKIQQATGGGAHTLAKNYRSRPGLVAFFNDAFGPTFAAMGLPPEATRIGEVERADLPGQRTPLGVWHLDGSNIDKRAAALAAGVKEALANGGEWTVARDGAAAPLDAGDIAVLCRKNDNCLKVANALATNGLKVAIERGGLFGTLEARLALAALRWCADRRDTLALAELAHLLHEGPEQPAWFEASLQDDRAEAIAALVPLSDDLRALADNGVHKTPLEFVDAVLTLGGVSKAIRRWGNVEDRLLNLEALRKLVAAYEADRQQNRAPTTATDLCAWLGEQEAAQPESRAEDAVTVVTYHGAKGLEWPFVILADLNDEPKGKAFGLHVASDVAGSEIDWNDPLAGRWLRFWPWPFGPQKSDVVLDATAANSDEGKAAARAEREERARLLYVGATRARDYLILALPKSKTSNWAWLDELRSDSGEKAFVAPAVGDDTVKVNGNPHAVRVATFVANDEAISAIPASAFESPAVEPQSFSPLTLKPSSEGVLEDARIVEEIDLGARLPFAGSPDMTSVGDALHRFLAADDPTWTDERRDALAKRLLGAWGVTGLDSAGRGDNGHPLPRLRR